MQDTKDARRRKLNWDALKNGGWREAWREFRRFTETVQTTGNQSNISIEALQHTCASSLWREDQEYVKELRHSEMGGSVKDDNPYRAHEGIPGGASTECEVVKATKS